MLGLRFMIYVLGFRVRGLGKQLNVYGLRFRVKKVSKLGA